MAIMQIRQARAGDAAGIADVHVRSWQAAYRGLMPQDYLDALDPLQKQARWETRLAEARWPASGVLVAEGEEMIVGFTGFTPTRDAGEDPAAVAEIGTLYSVPEVWGAGIGKRLMSAALQTLEQAGYTQATLWVLEANERARRFYEAAGWRTDGALDAETASGLPLTKVRYCRPLG
jgi:RimJ/RimL family protein N-acetyltransferase